MLGKIRKGVKWACMGLLILVTGCHSYDPIPLPNHWTGPRYFFNEIYMGYDTKPVPLPQYTDGGAYTLVVGKPSKGMVTRRYNYWKDSIPHYVPPSSYRIAPDAHSFFPYDTIPYTLLWDSAGRIIQVDSQIVVMALPSL